MPRPECAAEIVLERFKPKNAPRPFISYLHLHLISFYSVAVTLAAKVEDL